MFVSVVPHQRFGPVLKVISEISELPVLQEFEHFYGWSTNIPKYVECGRTTANQKLVTQSVKSILLRSEIPSGMSAKLRTVAASNNRDHARNLSYYCLLTLHI